MVELLTEIVVLRARAEDFDDHLRVRDGGITGRVAFDGAADDGDVRIGGEAGFENANAQVGAECAAGTATKLGEQCAANRQRKRGVARRSAGHRVDLAVEELVPDGTVLLEALRDRSGTSGGGEGQEGGSRRQGYTSRVVGTARRAPRWRSLARGSLGQISFDEAPQGLGEARLREDAAALVQRRALVRRLAQAGERDRLHELAADEQVAREDRGEQQHPRPPLRRIGAAVAHVAQARERRDGDRVGEAVLGQARHGPEEQARPPASRVERILVGALQRARPRGRGEGEHVRRVMVLVAGLQSRRVIVFWLQRVLYRARHQ